MKHPLLAVLAAPLLALALPSYSAEAQNPNADPVVDVEEDDPVMDAAIAESKRTLPEFLAALDNPPPQAGEFGIKYPLGGWEHIWVENLRRNGDRIVGTLANAPQQEGHRLGERVSVPLAEISDWAYRAPNGVMQGHRTTRVLFPQLPEDLRGAIAEDFGWQESGEQVPEPTS
jgi:uncharacterized protein YegJ (DUF2314 family)